LGFFIFFLTVYLKQTILIRNKLKLIKDKLMNKKKSRKYLKEIGCQIKLGRHKKNMTQKD